MLPIYAHLLGSEGYGILGMIEVVTSVLSILVSYGIASAVNRFYFERESEEDRNALISTAMFTMFLICAAVCLPAVVLNKPIAYLAFGEYGLGLYIILSICSFMIDSMAYTGQQYLLIRQRSVLVSIFSLLRLILAVTLNIYFIVILRLGILGVLYSHLITALTFFLIYNTYTLSKTKFHFNKNDAKELIYFSAPLIPGYAAMFIRTNADRIILRTFLGLAEIGVYSMVMKFSMLLGLFFQEPFMKTWIPKRMEICDSHNGPKIISDVVTIHLAIMVFAGLILSLEIPLLIKIMTPKEFWIPSTVGFIAVFARICFNTYYHLMFGLIYAKKTLKISQIQIATALISVIFYIVFIKYFGIKGAFLAALISYIFQCSISYYFANRFYKISYEWWKIFIFTASAIILFLIINPLTLDNDSISLFVKSNILPSLNKILIYFNLDGFKGGKLIFIINEKFIFLLEAVIKGLLGMTYILILVTLNIIPKEKLKDILKYLKNLLNGSSNSVKKNFLRKTNI